MLVNVQTSKILIIEYFITITKLLYNFRSLTSFYYLSSLLRLITICPSIRYIWSELVFLLLKFLLSIFVPWLRLFMLVFFHWKRLLLSVIYFFIRRLGKKNHRRNDNLTKAMEYRMANPKWEKQRYEKYNETEKVENCHDQNKICNPRNIAHD